MKPHSYIALLPCSFCLILLFGNVCCQDTSKNGTTLTFDPRSTASSESSFTDKESNTTSTSTSQLPFIMTSPESPSTSSSSETVTVTTLTTTASTEKSTADHPVSPSTSVKPAEAVPTPKNFEAILLKNRTVYLSWADVHHPNASYQIYMAYGNHRLQSKFIHVESTFLTEEYFKLRRLLRHVTGNTTTTFLKFKVRTAFDRRRTSDFTEPIVIGLPDFGPKSLTSHPRIIPVEQPSSVWKYVLPVVVLLIGAILTLIGIYTYRQVRFKRRYQHYMRTHFDTDSEAVSVSNDNFEFGNQSQHLTFGDNYREEDHLVIA